MSADAPIICEWNGEAFVPAGTVWARRADSAFVVGERYMVEAREPRSLESHNHYFACLHEAWQNLPEPLAERFPTEDHLRKFALIKAGYRDERSVACASTEEAARVAAFIEPIDDFAVVTVSSATVTVYTAKSQSMRAMGKKDFQASKDAVLGVLSAMIGTSTDALTANAESA